MPKTDDVFQLRKYLNNEYKTTDELTREQAWSFMHAAQHMLNHLRHEFKLPRWAENCSACFDGMPEAWFHGQGTLCARCFDEFEKSGIEDRMEFMEAKRKELKEREVP